ncbi:MAG: MoaD family protein [Bacillota bacterium]|nr:MoaD family protein [Bacillota bacterium]
MIVTVKPYLFLREAMGTKEIRLELPENTTVADLIAELAEHYGLPESFESKSGSLVFFDREVISGLIILIDGRNINLLNGKDTVLKESSVITLFPPAAGG